MRRLRHLSLAGLAALALAACDDDGAAAGPDAAGDAGWDVENRDDSGHQHRFHIAYRDLDSNDARMYVTDGADHVHAIFLDPAQLAALGAWEDVTLAFTEGHEHIFPISRPREPHGAVR